MPKNRVWTEFGKFAVGALGLLLLWAAGAQGHCTSTKTGVVSDVTVWAGDCAGTRIPTNGDFILVGTGHVVTLDVDLGTAVGGGIKRLDINGTGAMLVTDGAAAHTIYFGSVGTDPVGTGSGTTPGEDATMFGILLGKTTLTGGVDFTGATASNYVELRAANTTYPIYISHVYGTLGGNGGTSVKLKYTKLTNIGVDVANFRAVGVEGHASGQSTIEIDHCTFAGGFHAVRPGGANFGSLKFNFNVVTGMSSHSLYFTGSPTVAVEVTDNSFSAPAANSSVLYASTGLGNLSFARNVWAGSGSFTLGGLNQNAAPSTMTALTVADNVGYSSLPSATGSKCLILRSAAGQSGMAVTNMLCEGMYQTVYHIGASDATDTLTISGVIAVQDSNSAAGQGMMISYRGRYTLERSIGVLDSSASNLMWFGLASSGTHTPTFRYNIARCAGTGSSAGIGIQPGETGYPATAAVAHSNLVDNCYKGVKDGAATNTWAADYAGAGAHHNNAYSAVYSDVGGTNFDDGTNQHPHAVYGDTGHDPQYVFPARRLAGYDAWLGGPGTAANFVAEAAKRCGLLGAWDSRYNPVDAIYWVRQGFRPRNLALAMSGWTGSAATYAGPDPPILMHGVIN
jgi:hypothetical protein